MLEFVEIPADVNREFLRETGFTGMPYRVNEVYTDEVGRTLSEPIKVK